MYSVVQSNDGSMGWPFPEYKDKTVYGAMAYLKSNEGAGSYAEKQGLFILNPVGNIIKVMNSIHFFPKSMA